MNEKLVIHNRLVALRAERQVSRAQVAIAVGVNVQTIGFIERGDYSPSLELAFQIAQFFELPLEAVFSTQPLSPLSDIVYKRSSKK